MRETQNLARNPKQEIRTVTGVTPAVKLTEECVKKGNKTLRTKNESKKMLVTVFHGIDVRCQAEDNKWLTSRKSMSEEALHSKNNKKEMLPSIEIKDEVRDPKRLTLHDENIAGARPNVCKAHGKYGGGGAPNSNGKRTMTHPKNEFSKAETMKGYGNCDSQYGGNRSQRLDIHHDDKI